jgi:sulfate permease, SulP family
VTPQYIRDGQPHILQDKEVPHFVTILRIHGPFLFGTTDKLTEEAAKVSRSVSIVILRLRNMTAIDATGLHALEVLSDRFKKSGRTLLLCGARHQPARLLRQAEFVEHVGKENILPNIQSALKRAQWIQASFSGLGDEVAHDLERAPM